MKSDGSCLNTGWKSKKALNYLKILIEDRSVRDLLSMVQFNMVKVTIDDGLVKS